MKNKYLSWLTRLIFAIGFLGTSIINALRVDEPMTSKFFLWSITGAIIGSFVVEWAIRKGLGK